MEGEVFMAANLAQLVKDLLMVCGSTWCHRTICSRSILLKGFEKTWRFVTGPTSTRSPSWGSWVLRGTSMEIDSIGKKADKR